MSVHRLATPPTGGPFEKESVVCSDISSSSIVTRQTTETLLLDSLTLTSIFHVLAADPTNSISATTHLYDVHYTDELTLSLFSLYMSDLKKKCNLM